MLYFFLFPVQLGKEIIIKKDWALPILPILPIDEIEVRNRLAQEDDGREAFHSDDIFGVVDWEGNLLYRDSVSYGIALSDRFFINYGALPDRQVIQTQDGRIHSVVQEKGYPFFLQNRLFILDPNGSAVCEYDIPTKKLIWERKFASIITDIAVSSKTQGKGITVVALLNGTQFVVNPQGKTIDVLAGDDFGIPVSFACALSDSAEHIAVISGLDPQILRLYDYDKNVCTLIKEWKLESSFRRKILLQFSDSDKYLMFEQTNGLSILELSTGEIMSYDVAGRVIDILPGMTEQGLLGFSFLGSTGEVEFAFILPGKKQVFTLKSGSSSFFFRTRGKEIMIGLDKWIVKFNMDTG